MAGTEVGTYFVVPTILSFDGVDKQVNSKLGKVFGDFSKKGGKDLSKGIGEGLKSTEADVKKAADAYNKLRDKAEDALGRVRKEEAALQDLRDKGISSGARFVAAEERLAAARRNSTRAVRDANDSHTSFLNTQKRLGSASEDLGGKLNSMGRFAGSAGKQIAAAGAIAGGAALAGIALLGAGVISVGRELYDLGAAFDDVSDTIAFKTGATGKSLEALRKNVTDIAKDTPASIGTIGDVVAEVTRNLHLSGTELEGVSRSIVNLDRRVGEQLNIRNLGKAFRGFGVDAKGQQGALNQLYTATTRTGLSINDLIDSVVQGGAPLRELGLNFGQAAGLIASFEDAGLPADKMIAGLRKGLTEFAKDGKAAPEALRETITQIQKYIEAGNDPRAQNLANRLFGAKTGINFFDAIKTGALDLDALTGAVDSNVLSIDEMALATDDGAESWQKFKNNLEVALEPLASRVFDGVNEELDKFSQWVNTHEDEIIDFFVSFGEAAISAAEVTTSALAGVVDFVHLFDTIVMNSLSWLPGYDDEAAKAFNDSLGDLSDKLNAASDSGLWKDLRDNLHVYSDEAKTATENTDALEGSIGKIGSSAGASIGKVNDLKTALGQLPALPAFPGAPPGAPVGQSPLGAGNPGPTPLIPGVRPGSGGGGSGVGINLQLANSPQLGATGAISGAPRKVGSDSGLLPSTIAVKDQIASQFGNINDIGGWRPPDGFNEHSSGRAIDVMIPGWNTPAGKAEGDQVAATALKNPNVKYVLWQQTQWNSDGTSKPMSDRGSPTQNHMDHVHVYTYENAGAHPTGSPTATQPGATSLGMGMPGGSPNLVNAYGAGYEPGIGTPGVNEYGEPGYYQTDPKDIRQSQQAIADADDRVRRANQQVAEAEARKRELDIDASEAEKIAADNSVENARADAEKAKREAADARADAQETAKGTFTGAREAKKPKGGKGGSGDLSELGSIFGSFLKETTGFDGTIFPDFSTLMPVQMANTLLGALIPQGGDASGMAATSGSPFGIPDVAVPLMPTGGQHPGTGALPGPATTIINVDGSTNVAGNVGWDPNQMNRQRDQALNRAIPRIPIGS
jgi:phage-related minor tail protein